MQAQPYLFFEGRCEEALDFYKEKLGAKVDMLMRFKENPDQGGPGCEQVNPESVMHASMHIGDAYTGTDRPGHRQRKHRGKQRRYLLRPAQLLPYNKPVIPLLLEYIGTKVYFK